MKKTINSFLALISIFIFSSCMNQGLDDLPTYSEAEISNIKFEYRWWDEANKKMRVQELTTNRSIDKDNAQIDCELIVPPVNNTFKAEIREKVTLGNLAASVDISTAARLQPVDDSPMLGVPADFSKKKMSYKVTAADGKTVKVWEITITDFNK